MKIVTRYIADNGPMFETESQCRAYETFSAECALRLVFLAPHPASGGYDDGLWVQQHRATFLDVQRWFIHKAQEHLGDSYNIDWPAYLAAEHPVGESFLGRIVSESCPGPIASAFWRFRCTDHLFREWDQPYLALQVNKGIKP